jgi:DNA modification methylase
MAKKNDKPASAEASTVALLAAKPSVWPLDKIIPYPNNPRTHPAEQITLLAKLFVKHGVDQPIVVDEEGFILKGHGRRMAAVEAGMRSFPVVQHKGLSDNDKRAMRLADNQVALLSGWDANLLRLELTDLKAAGFDMELIGFSGVQLVSFMANPPGGDPEATPPRRPKPTSRTGDVWIMGNHRLICGDSTIKGDVERVLNGEEPNLMVSDPPYGVDYDPGWRAEPGKLGAADGSFLSTGGVRKGTVQNDTRADWCEAYKLFPGDVVYIWHGALFSSVVEDSLHRASFLTRAQIVWAKQHAPISRGDYHWRHECCWYMVRKGRTGNWSGDRKQNTVWDIANMNAFGGVKEDTKTEHGTQKPVECMRRPIINNSKPGDYVYEPFSGSGTTIIACEMTTRYCLAIELDPAYVDMAVERWQAFAKQEAVLEGDGRTFAEIAKARAKRAPAAKRKAPGGQIPGP